MPSLPLAKREPVELTAVVKPRTALYQYRTLSQRAANPNRAKRSDTASSAASIVPNYFAVESR